MTKQCNAIEPNSKVLCGQLINHAGPHMMTLYWNDTCPQQIVVGNSWILGCQRERNHSGSHQYNGNMNERDPYGSGYWIDQINWFSPYGT